MKTIILPKPQYIPTLVIALSDKLKAELIATLESKKLFKVTNILTDGEALFEILESQNPDYLLIDAELPKGGGFGFLKKLNRIKPKTKVIIYSSNNNPDYLKVFLSSPALGFIQQGCGMKDFICSLQTIFEGKRLILPQIGSFRQNENQSKRNLCDLSSLTEREMDVWELLIKAKTEKEIAEELCISTSTVRTHKNKISEKLNIKGKMKITKLAYSQSSFSSININV